MHELLTSFCPSAWLQEVEAAALSRKGLKQTKAYKVSRAALKEELLAKKQQRLHQDIEPTAASKETPLPLAAGHETSDNKIVKMDAVSGAAAEGREGAKGQAAAGTMAGFFDKFMADHAWAFLHVRGSAAGSKTAAKQVDAAAKEPMATRIKLSIGFRKLVSKTRTFVGSCLSPSVQAE
jgi:hypothetical protein